MSSVPVLAGAIAAWREEHEPVLRLWAACDLVEMTVRLASLVGLADAVARAGGTVPEALLRQVRPRLDEPTLGKWQGIALAVGAFVREGPGPRVGAGLHALVLDEIAPLLDGDDPLDPTRSLRAMRNRLAHGGGIGRAGAERLLARWEPALDALCARLDGLALGIAARSGDGWVSLVGADARPGPALRHASLDALDAGEQVAAIEGDAAVGLGPLAAWGPLHADGPVALQVYARRVDVRVLLTPIATEDIAQSEGNPLAAATLARWLKAEGSAAPPRGWVVAGFEAALLREAQAFVGRGAELERCVRALDGRGVWAVLGRAGTGKSLLMARLTQHLASEPESTPWLVWRFKAGDPRCHRATFLAFLAERLAARCGVTVGEGAVTLARVVELARSAGPTRLVIDGLDEILDIDPTFADVLVRVANPEWTLLVAGRPDAAVRAALARVAANEVFHDGLPLMGDDDIRTMLLERLGPLRRVLLRHDRSVGEGSENALVARIARVSGGLPLYVNYLLGDLLSGRAHLERLDALPPTLGAYHDQLLRRGSTGDVQIVATWSLVAVCAAREPLDPDALGALFTHRGLIPDDADTLDLVGRALATIGGLLRAEPGTGLVPYHHSLRQHVLASPELGATVAACTRTFEALAALSPGDAPRALQGYLLRHGGAHLIAAGRNGAATTRLAAWQARMGEDQLRRDLGDLAAALGSGSRDPVDPATLLEVLVLRPENALLLPGAAHLYRHAPTFLESDAADAILLGVALTYALALAIAGVHRDTLDAVDLARLRGWADDHTCPVQYAALYALDYLAMRHPEAWPPHALTATATGGGRPPPAGNVYDRMVVLNHLAYRACRGEDPGALVAPGPVWGSPWPYLATDEALAFALYAWRTDREWPGAPGLPPPEQVRALIPALVAIDARRAALDEKGVVPEPMAFVTRHYWTLLDRLEALMLGLDELMGLEAWHDLGCLLLAHPAWQVGEAAAEALSRRWRDHPEDRPRLRALARRLEPFAGAGLLGDRDLAMPTLARLLVTDVEDTDEVIDALRPFLASPSSHQRAKAILDLTQIVRMLTPAGATRTLSAVAPLMEALTGEADIWAVHELAEWVRVVEVRGLGRPGFDADRNPLLARIPDWRTLPYNDLVAALDRSLSLPAVPS